MGIKQDRLTEQDLAGFSLQPMVHDALVDYVRERGLEPGQVRVLDWGCGRGRSVAWLRRAGYEAFGIDINRRWIENGRPLLAEWGLDAEKILLHLDDLHALEPESFDFIFSEQVFEHVADLDQTVKAVARMTRPGGRGIHIFPGRLNFLEGHLYMPFVHWLPKNGLRRAAIALCWRCGIGPSVETGPWRVHHGRSRREQVDAFYRYSVGNTYYRRSAEVARALHDAGLSVTHWQRWSWLRHCVPVRAWAQDGLGVGQTVLLTSR